MKPDVLKLIARLGLLGLPFAVLIGTYVVTDPFRIIYPQEWGNYYDDQPFELNREYVSTEILLANYPQQQYDAYVFGSSRALPYHCSEWIRYIPGAHPFHYPAAQETIYGIYHKLLLLDRLQMPVRQALIVVDDSALKIVSDREDHLHISHPAVSGEGRLRFQAAFLQDYFLSGFWLGYLDHRLFGKLRPYMKGIFAIRPGAVRIDPVTNDYFFEAEERMLASEPARFYEERKGEFPPRTCQDSCYRERVVGTKQRQMLVDMAKVLNRRGTAFKIVVTPFYDQLQLHPEDRHVLEEIFGRQNVYDFTGRNEFTASMEDYYDATHYRPHIANAILERIYRPGAGHHPAGH